MYLPSAPMPFLAGARSLVASDDIIGQGNQHGRDVIQVVEMAFVRTLVGSAASISACPSWQTAEPGAGGQVEHKSTSERAFEEIEVADIYFDPSENFETAISNSPDLPSSFSGWTSPKQDLKMR